MVFAGPDLAFALATWGDEVAAAGVLKLVGVGTGLDVGIKGVAVHRDILAGAGVVERVGGEGGCV